MPPFFPKKIKDLRREKKISQEQLARLLQVTKKTVAEWEQGRQPPSPERLLQLARMTQAGPLRRWFTQEALQRIGGDPRFVLDTFLGQTGTGAATRPLPPTQLQLVAPADWSARLRALEQVGHFTPVPLLKDAAAAGAPRVLTDEDIESYVVVPFAWCPNAENYTCLYVRGDSMAPILHDGAIVAVDHTQRDPRALQHQMVAARHDDGVTIKWLERRPGGELVLVAENKEHPAIVLPRAQENPILGLVAWYWNRQV